MKCRGLAGAVSRHTQNWNQVGYGDRKGGEVAGGKREDGGEGEQHEEDALAATEDRLGKSERRELS